MARIRLALLYAACLPLAWGAVELTLGLRPRPHFDPGMPAAYRIRDDAVGVRPAPGVSWREALWLGDEPIFDVVYTTDAHGRRVTPEPVGGGAALCILFFGGSFTFGTGIADDETLPWQTSLATGRRHQVHNFSFGGWGPHQMLAALETGEVERSLACEPTHAIYVSVQDHIRRVAGRSPWDPHGPRFELRSGGRLERDGNFDDRPSFPGSWPLLGKSQILRILAEHFEPKPADFDRFAEVVAASRDRLETRWPGIDFHVLLWDKRWKQDPEYWEGLGRRGLRVHPVSEILPDQREAAARYAISPHDGHPNRTANERIAAWIARVWLGEARGAPAPASASAPSRAGGP
ncbi:MAG: hypothetical protein E4H11_05080 [Myxococcales bacterium]|nr:MAG: hypothetical protein E4H11_05080 [Myxococcales bacterium]